MTHGIFLNRSMCLLFLATIVFSACKTSTNPVEDEQLSLITSELDTTTVRSGPVVFTVTVIDPSGYGVSGAYIDFYDPIEARQRHEGPTPEDGTWQFTDTIANSLGGGSFEFSFIAEHTGAISSDSVRLWVVAPDLRGWAIDTIQVNSWFNSEIGVRWSRPALDKGTDTLFVLGQQGDTIGEQTIFYPVSSAIVYPEFSGVDTIFVHNAYLSSASIAWASSETEFGIQLYTRADSSYSTFYGLNCSDLGTLPVNYDYALVDLVLTDDPRSPSGVALVSPSLSSLSGFSGGRVTALYHPVQFIDSGNGLQELYYSNDLSTYVNGVAPLQEIMLPDSSAYSTAFIAVTEDGNYAQVLIGPLTHDWQNYPMTNVEISYQQTPNLPYAGRGRHK